jgi:hypothetical protein
MSTMSWIWFASVTGALLFAAAGFFGAPAIGRGGRREALRAIAEAEERAEAARVATAEALDELARAAENDARRRATLDDQAMMVSRLQHEILTLRHESGASTSLQQDLAKCDRELVAAKASLARVTRDYESLAAKQRRAVDELRAETDSLRREAALVLERAAAQQKAIEAVRDENASLRMGSSELAELKKRCAAMSDENERLRASAFVTDSEGKARRPSPTIPEYEDSGPEGSMDNASLQRFVDDVARMPSVSAAALTDELGFLVVGTGDHTEALAAFGAYLTEAGARACGVLPMHAVHKVSIQDDSGITLTARTIASAPNELVLVTLGVDDRNHAQPDRHGMERSS